MKNFGAKELQYGSSEENKPILIVDGIMGCGKTTSIINYINNAPEDSKFVYVTPFLSEVQRIKEACKDKNFVEPVYTKGINSKLIGFQKMVEQGENIVTTHALFQLLGKNELKLFAFNDYTLIMDEVANVIEPFFLSKPDINVIFKEAQLATVSQNGAVKWIKDDYSGKFDEFKKQVQLGNMYCYGGNFFLWTFPIEVFRSFSTTFILTYMFDGQIQSGYYKINGMKYKYVHVKSNKEGHPDDAFQLTDYTFVDDVFDEPMKLDTTRLYSLMNICDNKKWNLIGREKTALSKSWYEKASKGGEVTELDILRNKCRRFFIEQCNTAKDFMWTTFSDYRNQITRRDFGKGFVSCNARATNDYRNKTTLAYLVNRYINPNIKQFLNGQHASIDEDLYALSEMLQWIFRSQIRDGKPITLYIPSSRMRELLQKWGNNQI